MIEGDYYKLILLFGAALSFLMSFYLWLFPYKSFSSKVLGFLIFTWSLTAASYALQSRAFFMRFPHLFGWSSSIAILFFPLLYLFIINHLYKDQNKFKKVFYHFIPYILFVLLQSPFFILSADAKRAIIEEQWMTPRMITIINWFNLVIISQGIVYTALSIRALQHFRYFRNKKLSKIQIRSLKWLMQFVVLNVILWGVGTTGVLIGVLQFNIPVDPFDIFYMGTMVLVIWMGYYVIRNPNLFSMDKKLVNVEEGTNKPKDKEASIANRADLNQLVSFLQESKPYLNTKLNMQDLVEGTGLSKHRISELLNNELQKSFYDVINEYRVKEAIRLLESGLHKEYSLEHIATKSGFNSIASFYRIFKNQTGQTPKRYLSSNE